MGLGRRLVLTRSVVLIPWALDTHGSRDIAPAEQLLTAELSNGDNAALYPLRSGLLVAGQDLSGLLGSQHGVRV